MSGKLIVILVLMLSSCLKEKTIKQSVIRPATQNQAAGFDEFKKEGACDSQEDIQKKLEKELTKKDNSDLLQGEPDCAVK